MDKKKELIKRENIIMEGNSFYEIDLECMRRKEKEKEERINSKQEKRGCEITASTEKEDFSFKMNERSSFMLKLTCDENFNYKL